MSRAVAITLSALVFGAVLAAVPMVENLYARTAVSGLAYGFLAFSLLRIAKRYGKS